MEDDFERSGPGKFGEDGGIRDNQPPRDHGQKHAVGSFLPAFSLWAYGTRLQQDHEIVATGSSLTGRGAASTIMHENE